MNFIYINRIINIILYIYKNISKMIFNESLKIINVEFNFLIIENIFFSWKRRNYGGFFSKEQKINMNGKLKTLKGILF